MTPRHVVQSSPSVHPVLGAVIGLNRKVRVFRAYDTATWYAAQVSVGLQAAVIGRAEPTLTAPGVTPQAGPAKVVWRVSPAIELGDDMAERPDPPAYLLPGRGLSCRG